jgi:3-hydroxy-9,10-secoandrosta-1,3,5(10)-triene-9,17-dione monooxygenase
MGLDLVGESRRLAPELAAAAPEDDALRQLSDRTWKNLSSVGVLRAMQPARFGGGEVKLVEFVDAAMELSRSSPSAGWVAGVVGVHPWQLALFPEEAQQEMWGSDPTAMHSSSYNPTGKAEKVPGGYKLYGRWSFSSGCDHCKAVNLGAIAGGRDIGGTTVPDFRSFLLFRDQYRIEDNWNVAGLKGTGSKDIVVDDAFVPEHRTQSHLDYAANAPLPGRKLNDGPLYRLPWSVVFNMALASSVLGSARGFIEMWTEQSKARSMSLGGGRVADDAIMQQRLAHAIWDLDVSVTRMRADAVELWQMAEAHEPASMELRARMRWNMNRGCEVVGRAVNDLFHAASGRSIYLDQPLQRRYQDVQGALGHAFLLPDSLARSVGGTLLGTSKPEIVL